MWVQRQRVPRTVPIKPIPAGEIKQDSTSPRAALAGGCDLLIGKLLVLNLVDVLHDVCSNEECPGSVFLIVF